MAWLSLLMGCAFNPGLQNARFARQQGWRVLEVPGQGFIHQVYVHQGRAIQAKTWHVYIEGDGQPWIAGRYPAADPTVVSPLMLRLASQDPAAKLYLGRPCYEGQASSAVCRPWWWTHGRYSLQIVDSMVAALQRALPQYGFQPLTLIGHSGGATLALLMAIRMPQVNRLILIAPNLDIEVWAGLHGYTPLQGSLNPKEAYPLPERIEVMYFFGEDDHNTPADLFRPWLEEQPNSRVFTCQECGHEKGWEAYWPSIMKRLQGIW